MEQRAAIDDDVGADLVPPSVERIAGDRAVALRGIVEEQRDEARAEDRSVRLFLEALDLLANNWLPVDRRLLPWTHRD